MLDPYGAEFTKNNISCELKISGLYLMILKTRLRIKCKNFIHGSRKNFIHGSRKNAVEVDSVWCTFCIAFGKEGSGSSTGARKRKFTENIE